MPLCLAIALAAAAASPDAATVTRLVDRFNTARAAFADAALAATLAPEYQEISPVGDVDDRAKVIGFYRPADRRPAPAMTGSERAVALHGGWAIVTEKLSFVVPRPDGTTLTRSLRVRYVAAKGPAGWQLASTQYTGISAGK